MNLKKRIIERLNETISSLLMLLEENTNNIIANNILFVVKSIDENNLSDPLNQENRVKLLKTKKSTLEELVEEILGQKSIISWVDLTMLYADVNELVIQVTLVKVNKHDKEINYHCYLTPPPNCKKMKNLIVIGG